jgi:hypothetical protein
VGVLREFGLVDESHLEKALAAAFSKSRLVGMLT